MILIWKNVRNVARARLVLELLDELLTRQETQVIMNSIVYALLETIPNLELIENEQLPMIMLSALTRVSLPQSFKFSKIPANAWELFDRPAILRVTKNNIIPTIKQYADGIRAMYLFFSAFEGFDRFFLDLKPEDKPSEKIRQYVESSLRRLSKISPRVEELTGEE